MSKVSNKVKSTLNKLNNKSTFISLLKILVSILSLVYIIVGYKYLKNLDNQKCQCAIRQDKYKKLRKLILIIIGFYFLPLTILLIGNVLPKLAAETYMKYLVYLSPLIMLAVIIYRIVYSYNVFKFTSKIVKDECSCANNNFRAFLQYYSVFDLISCFVAITLFLGTTFVLVNLYKKNLK